MPTLTSVFNVIGIFLQYSLLFLIYYFLFRVITMISKDLNKPSQRHEAEPIHGSSNYYQGKLVVVESGPVNLSQTSFPLGEAISIGRNAHNDIIIDDAFVSYEHATINQNKLGYWLTDLNSTNKTYLNHRPLVEKVLLKNGDLIKIGAVTFSFEG